MQCAACLLEVEHLEGRAEVHSIVGIPWVGGNFSLIAPLKCGEKSDVKKMTSPVHSVFQEGASLRPKSAAAFEVVCC